MYYWLHSTALGARKEVEAILEIDIVPVQELSTCQTDEAHTDEEMYQKAFTTSTVFVNKANLCTADLKKKRY